jgi:isopenicillin-N epimerase
MTWEIGSDTIRSAFALDPSVTFLNHGSFGATPRAVLAEQARWQAEMEAEPVLFLGRRLGSLLAPVRERVAAFVNADAEGIVLVPNATTGVNAVLWSLEWQPGDEILCADQSYNAVLQTVRHVASRTGAVLTQARLPFPVQEEAEIVAAFAAAITPRTKLLLVDHLTSPTGLRMPIEALVALAQSHGVPILIDGAHGPGLLPIDLKALGADFYTGNLHKWAFAPKGSALLYVAPAWRGRIHPPVTSHAYGFDWRAEFDWTGTFDASAWLAIPAGLDFHASFPGINERCHELVRAGQRQIAEALGVSSPYPDSPRFYASLALVPFDMPFDGNFAILAAQTGRLYDEHRIEAPFTAFDQRVWLRVSAQIYNRPADYERLASVLRAGWR